MADDRIHSFPPIVDSACRVLVLGTMPGIASLQRVQYYGHERNLFWPIVFSLFGRECPADYAVRTAFLLEQHIALWDVLHSCVRRTSADSDIRNAEANPIPELLEAHPTIEAVFCNGQGAAGLYRRHIAGRLNKALPMTVLPSTSPAYAIPAERKLAGWQPLRHYLETFLE